MKLRFILKGIDGNDVYVKTLWTKARREEADWGFFLESVNDLKPFFLYLLYTDNRYDNSIQIFLKDQKRL